MKRLARNLAAGMTAVSLLGGCEAAPSHRAPTNEIEQFVVQYPTLPAAVGRHVLSAVWINASYKYEANLGIDYEGGSGAMVSVKGQRFVLTAAHVVGKDVPHCAEGNIVFNSSGAPNQNIGFAGVTKQSKVESIKPELSAAPSDTWAYNNTFDAALLQIKQGSPLNAKG